MCVGARDAPEHQPFCCLKDWMEPEWCTIATVGCARCVFYTLVKRNPRFKEPNCGEHVSSECGAVCVGVAPAAAIPAGRARGGRMRKNNKNRKEEKKKEKKGRRKNPRSNTCLSSACSHPSDTDTNHHHHHRPRPSPWRREAGAVLAISTRSSPPFSSPPPPLCILIY